jgi:MFS family permease
VAREADEPGRSFLVALVLFTFLMNLLARGTQESFAVFLLPVQKGLGLTRPQITLTYAANMLAYGLSAPFAGQLVDRLGARAAYGFGLTSLGLGYLLAGFATQLWHYVLAVGVLGGLGAAALGMIAASALLSRWFTHRIGAVMSVPYAAVGVGMLLLPPITQLLLSYYDWRTTYQILGGLVLLLLPAALLFPLRRISAGSRHWQAVRAAATASPAGAWTASSATRTGAFWGLFAVYLFTSIAAYSVTPHSVAYLVEKGFHPLVAAGAFGLTGALSVVGMLSIGWISDRFGRRQTATLSYLSTMLGIGCLSLVGVWPSLILVYAFVAFFGLMQGVRGPIIVAMVAVLFPGGGVGAIYGTLSLAMGLGAALGAWTSGLLFGVTGNYLASFLLAIASAFAGLLCFWVVPSLRHERIAPGEGASNGR